MTTDAEINAAMEKCLASYGKHLAKSKDGQVIERDAYVLCNGGFVSGPKNMVVPGRTLTIDEARELKSHIEQLYDGPERWLLWTLSEQPELHNAGFYQYPTINATMTLGANNVEHKPVEGFDVREVTDEAGALLFEKLREEARGETFPDNPKRSDYLDERALASFHRLWIGYVDGAPVATGAIFEADGVSMIKNIATARTFRRRGIGAAMSVHVKRQATATPVLDADAGAPSLYERLGFHRMGELRFWTLR